MRKTVLVAGSLAFLLTACGQVPAAPQQYDTSSYSSDEDCDAEDLAEGDSDCYGIDLKSKKKKKKVKSGYGYSSSKPKSSYGYSSSKPKSSYKSSRSSSSRSRSRR